MTDLLTPDEHEALELTADLGRVMRRVIGNDNGPDVAEAVAALHVIQNMVRGQAAARAYPDRYRLLGKTW